MPFTTRSIAANTKSVLLAFSLISLAACAATGPITSDAQPGSAGATGNGDVLALLPGQYDNHAQVWQASQSKAALPPVHVRQRIVASKGMDHTWDWQLTMTGADGKPLVAHWRYHLRSLPDGQLMMTPSRALPAKASTTDPQWAELTPCAMQGRATGGRLQLAASKDACSAIIAGLGSAAALLPLALNFDGKKLITKTYSDLARGNDAYQEARPVHWYRGWAAINGAGPDAKADSKDWHMQRDLRIGNQGQDVAIRWRDGNPSGYSLRLETLHYLKRDMQVLRLSLVRDQDDSTVAYAWADPGAEHIGLNLGWVQAGLTRGPSGQTGDRNP
ncbi:MAG: hypothetical protein WCD36_08935 [Rhodanobacteraceae bacterium]